MRLQGSRRCHAQSTPTGRPALRAGLGVCASPNLGSCWTETQARHDPAPTHLPRPRPWPQHASRPGQPAAQLALWTDQHKGRMGIPSPAVRAMAYGINNPRHLLGILPAASSTGPGSAVPAETPRHIPDSASCWRSKMCLSSAQAPIILVDTHRSRPWSRSTRSRKPRRVQRETKRSRQSYCAMNLGRRTPQAPYCPNPGAARRQKLARPRHRRRCPEKTMPAPQR